MLKRTTALLLFILGYICTYAQPATPAPAGSNDTGIHLHIGLLTCDPGDREVYEVFGHSAIRVIDSSAHTDIVYNYGVFNYGPNFEIQFMRGKLLYCIATDDFMSFIQEYQAEERSVYERELLISNREKAAILAFLKWNMLPENRYYKYDFFFDNCATRIRDIFTRPAVFGSDFHFASVLPPGKQLTFRDIINQYFFRDHWTRVGVNILLGSRIDRVMSNADIMFLPDYLRDGIAGATVKGKPIAAPSVGLLIEYNLLPLPGINWVMVLTCSLALLTLLGFAIRPLRLLGSIMSAVVLYITGLLGCIILIMWFGTDHQGCSNNFNILWALPLNLVIGLFSRKFRGKYALAATALIFVALLLHILHVQGLIIELWPLLFCLLLIYGKMYKDSKIEIMKPVADAGAQRIFYRKMGSGPALVLIHGFPENGTLWRNIWDELATSYTLIIPDLPGIGDTPLLGDTSIMQMAGSIKAILDDEHIDKAVIAGHSMGGYVALALAHKYPDCIAGLSLVHSSPLPDDEEKKKNRLQAISLIERGAQKIFISQMVPNLFAPEFVTDNSLVVNNQIDEASKMSPEAMVNFYRAMLNRDSRTDVLETATFPLQWIMGGKDNVSPYKKILELCYRSQINFVTFYPECGHMSMVEMPGRLQKDLGAFTSYCYNRSTGAHE